MIRFCAVLSTLFFLLSQGFAQRNSEQTILKLSAENCLYCSQSVQNAQFFTQEEHLLYQVYHQLHTNLEAGEYHSAMQNLNQCFALIEENENDELLFNLLVLRSTMYGFFKLHSYELRDMQKATKIVPHDYRWEEYLVYNYSSAFINQNRVEDAFEVLQEWRFDQEHDSTPIDVLQGNYYNLGVCYRWTEKYDSAFYFLNKSLILEYEENDSTGMVECYMELGNLYYDQYKDDSAIYYFKKADELSKAVNDIDLMLYTTYNMSVVEENAQNSTEALKYRKEYDSIRDSLQSRDKLWEMAQEEKKFAVELKEKEIQIIEQEKEFKSQQFIVERSRRNIVLGAAVLLLIAVALILFFYRKSIAKNKTIESQRQQLEVSNQTKNKILSIVAHDLKSPVNRMVSNNERLSLHVEESALESKYKSLFQTNTELGRRTFQMIDNLLIWALQENDQFYTEKEKIDLKRMVEQVVYVYEPMLQQKSLHLDCEVDERAVVYMDRNSLKIVLRNLIDNAIKYSTEGGRIQIQSESNENDHGLLTIADNGLGMSKEILTQVQKASVSPGGIDVDGRRGTGIGLNLCSSLLKQNEGEMRIESEEGQGTTIKLKLKNYEKN